MLATLYTGLRVTFTSQCVDAVENSSCRINNLQVVIMAAIMLILRLSGNHADHERLRAAGVPALGTQEWHDAQGLVEQTAALETA